MLYSKLALTTIKENPVEAEIISHQLMLRAGLIRKLGSGLFTWMPFGLRVLRKVEAVIREEMNRAGAQELLMPAIQPSELWLESNRWDQYGSLLLRMKDRHQRDYCFGPTHEEVITDLARRELKSHKQLPINFYQIQTKFRDEIRPRFGVMRAREFIMKDAYSFHVDQKSLEEGYELMHKAYSSAFTRLGLKFRIVDADNGEIGGNRSQEFHVIAASGEDAIVYCDEEKYASNVESAKIKKLSDSRGIAKRERKKVATPNTKDIKSLCKFLDIDPEETLKTLIINGTEEPIAFIIRGDHELNLIKVAKMSGVSLPVTMASPETIKKYTGFTLGYLGPLNLNITTYYDHAVGIMSDFVCGANETDYHYINVNFIRDIDEPETYDLRIVKDGDPSPNGKGVLRVARGIEVGHIFQLGTKYSEAMQATVQNKEGKETPMAMGCYGIGITRIVGASIEQSHDEKGIIWPEALAPFNLIIIPIGFDKSTDVKNYTERLYDQLVELGHEVLLDDRQIRPGVKFADAELIGIPHRVVISEKNIKNNKIEYQKRTNEHSDLFSVDELIKLLS